MLNFELLFDLLVVYLVILIIIQLIKLFKPNVKIKMGERGTELEEIGFLDIKSRVSEKGRATDVKLANDPMPAVVGTILISEKKGQIRIASGTTDSVTGNDEFKRVGFVDENGYIYKKRNKNAEPEQIGFLAKPSKPNEPTLVGERTWKDLWYSRRLNAYYGAPLVGSTELAVATAAQEKPAANAEPEKKGFRLGKKKEEEQKESPQPEVKVEEENKPLTFSALAFFGDARLPSDKEDEEVAEEAIEEEKGSMVEAMDNAVDAAMDKVEEVVSGIVSAVDDAMDEVEDKLADLTEATEAKGDSDSVVDEGGEEAKVSQKEPQEEPPVAPSYPYGAEKDYLDGLLKDKEFVSTLNAILKEMVKVEGGSFMMGADAATSTKKYQIGLNEGPVHPVTLQTFYIGKYPVTQKYWQAIMGNEPPKQNDTYPVAPVNWEDCHLFTKRLSYLTKLSFHLPTEAQWEYAARSGKYNESYIYSGSDNFSVVGQGDQYKSVGQKKPNKLGIYDMSGLVREWCQDWYAERYSPENQSDPMGPSEPEDPMLPRHVVRSPAGNGTVTNRKGETSQAVDEKEFKSYGFRIVCDHVPDEMVTLLGEHRPPELIGSARLCGYVDPTPAGTPITDEARAAAFSLFYGLAARKADYDEFLGESGTGWRDTALLSSLIYSALFLIIYFVNTVIFRYPLLGNQMNALVVMTAAYFVVWATVRFIKKEKIENGHSMQAFLDIFNKSLGVKVLDYFIIIAGALGLFLSYRYFDSDFVPLMFAIIFGAAVNLTIRPNSVPWKVNNPLKPLPSLDLQELDVEIERPEGERDNKICEFDWDLDPLYNTGKKVHGHISMGIDSEDIGNLRLDNPYFLEMPSLFNNTGALKVYVRRMLSYLHDANSPDRTLRLRYVLQEIKKISDKNCLDEIDRLQFVLDFVQEPNIRYKLDCECREDLACPDQYMRFPDETLYDHVGDCKSKSFLAANMYYMMGYDVLLLLSTNLQHAAIAIVMNEDMETFFQQKNPVGFENAVKEFKGKRYIFCETTRDDFKIGDLGKTKSIEEFDIIIDLTHKEDDDEQE